MPPKWVFPYVIEQSRNVITGAPFDHGPDSDLFADFKAKVGKLAIPPATKDALIADARAAMTQSMAPAYRRADRDDDRAGEARRDRRRHLALQGWRGAICRAAANITRRPT